MLIIALFLNASQHDYLHPGLCVDQPSLYTTMQRWQQSSHCCWLRSGFQISGQDVAVAHIEPVFSLNSRSTMLEPEYM